MLPGQLNTIQSFKDVYINIYSSTNVSVTDTISSIIRIDSETSRPQNLLEFLSLV